MAKVFQLIAAFVHKLGPRNMSKDSCIFCDILNDKNETKVEAETDEFIIFKDINPASTHHYLIVPKIHYESLNVLDKSHIRMVSHMEDELRKFFELNSINTTEALFGFHLPPYISVNHLHLHGITPQSEMDWIFRYLFKPQAWYFKNAKEAVAYLSQKENKS